MNDSKAPSEAVDPVITHTQDWVKKAVIGLQLCPFARAVHEQKQIHYVASQARTPDALLVDLKRELLSLMATDPAEIDTTLLIHPYTLNDFLDFNDFSDHTEALIEELELTDEIQIATFHPQFQFADSSPEDIENYSNRAPYPTLQLLRESSVEVAIDEYGDTDKIFQKNIQTLRKLGLAGWKKLKLHEA
jgi:hypothetical protein